MARRRIVLIAPFLLEEWMRGLALRPGESVASDAPADLKIVGCGWDEQRNEVRLAVESSAFDEVADGMFAPTWSPVFTTHRMSEFEAAMAVLMGD
jgi:hypothetical protein